MKKILGIILVLILLMIGGAFYYIDSILKTAVEKGGTVAVGTPTIVNSVNLGLFSGKLDMEGLTVGNPQGFETPHFLQMKKFFVAVKLNSLIKDRVQVSAIVLDGLNINLEKKRQSRETNVQEILNHLKTLDTGKKKEPGKKETGKKSGKKITVDLLEIKNVSAVAIFAPALGEKGKVEIKVPDQTIKNIGSDNKGLTLEELSVLIVSKVLDAIAKSGQGLPLDFKNQLDTGLQQIKGMTTDLEGTAKTVIESSAGELGKKAEEKSGTVVDKAEKLLKFK